MDAIMRAIALDFLGLRERRVPAKAAALQCALFHRCTETRVLIAYEMIEHERTHARLF
jgi:hypothetical protein